MKEIIDWDGVKVNTGDKVRGEGVLRCQDNFTIDITPIVTVREQNGIIYFGQLSMASFKRFWKVNQED